MYDGKKTHGALLSRDVLIDELSTRNNVTIHEIASTETYSINGTAYPGPVKIIVIS